jgi:hypothetical protein
VRYLNPIASFRMNAALALNWARLSVSRLCLLPDESTGSRMKAERRRMKGSPVLPKRGALDSADDARLFDDETELSLVA